METETNTTPASAAPQFGEMSFEDALRAVVSARQPQEPPVDVAAPPSKEEKAQEAPKEVPAEPAPKAPDEATAARIQRFLEREQQISEREAKFTSWESEKAALQAELAQFRSAKEAFRRNPKEYIRSLDPEFKPIDLANELFTEELGDNAPPEFKAKVAERRIQSEVERRVSEVEKKFESRFAAIEQIERQARFDQYSAGVQTALASVAPEMDALHKVAKARPEATLQAALKIADKAAAQGKLLTPTEVVTQLNAELMQLRSLFAPEPAPTATTGSAPTSKTTETTTLRNSNQQVVPSKTDEDEDARLFYAAIEAAKRVRAAQT